MLHEIGAQVYVGDHPGDVVAAIGADAVSVAVSTGPTPAAELSAAGADVVLESLASFPEWLDEHVLNVRLAQLDAALVEVGRPRPAGRRLLRWRRLGLRARRCRAGPRPGAGRGGDRRLAVAGDRRAAGGASASRLTWASGTSPRRPTSSTATATSPTPETVAITANPSWSTYSLPWPDVANGATVVTGTNADDARAGFRPGIRAAEERGAIAPLRDAGLTKAQVREASRRWGLGTWDKPAAACLSSRVAYGIPVTRERLERIDRAELAARAELTGAELAAANVRVRDLGDGQARVEVDRDLLPQLIGPAATAGPPSWASDSWRRFAPPASTGPRSTRAASGPGR